MAEVTLADIERACWQLSGWRVDQRSVDELLAVIRAYVEHARPGGAVAVSAVDKAPERPAEAVSSARGAMDPQGPGEVVQSGPGGVRVPGGQMVTFTGTFTGMITTAAQREAEPAPVRPLRGAVKEAAPMRTEGPGPKRTCRKCGGTFLLEEFTRDYSRGVAGRKTACRACENQRKRDGRRAKTAARREVQAQVRTLAKVVAA